MHFVQAKSILSAKNGMNIYRGCVHGCIYCDSRSRCYGMNHAFEDIEVKQNAPELLETALRRKRKRCMIGTGSMSDPYNPLEGDLGLTRRCLELILQYGCGLSILTKSDRILRDIDLLDEINRKTKCVAQMTLTTADDRLCAIVEPNVSPTSARLAALREMHKRGIPTVVWLCPLLPWINDTEENLQQILEAALAAGVSGILNFGMGLTLREGCREYYYQQLDQSFPKMRERYIHHFGSAYELLSDNADRLTNIFTDFCSEHQLMVHTDEIFSFLNDFPDSSPSQLSLFS